MRDTKNHRIALRNVTPSRLKKIKKFETLLSEIGALKYVGKFTTVLCIELRWLDNKITKKEIVGYFHFVYMDNEIFVNLFEVMPFFRGNGIGTQAIYALINQCGDNKIKKITIMEVSKMALDGKNTEIYFWIKAFKKLGLPLIMEQGEKAGHTNFIINLGEEQ